MLLVYKRGDCMRKFFQDVIVEVAYYLEIALSVILATAIIFFSLALFHDLFSMLIKMLISCSRLSLLAP